MDELYAKQMVVFAMVVVVVQIFATIPLLHYLILVAIITSWVVRQDRLMITSWQNGLIGLRL